MKTYYEKYSKGETKYWMSIECQAEFKIEQQMDREELERRPKVGKQALYKEWMYCTKIYTGLAIVLGWLGVFAA